MRRRERSRPRGTFSARREPIHPVPRFVERIGLGSCIPTVLTANLKPPDPEASRDELTPKASSLRRGSPADGYHGR